MYYSFFVLASFSNADMNICDFERNDTNMMRVDHFVLFRAM